MSSWALALRARGLPHCQAVTTATGARLRSFTPWRDDRNTTLSAVHNVPRFRLVVTPVRYGHESVQRRESEHSYGTSWSSTCAEVPVPSSHTEPSASRSIHGSGSVTCEG